MFETEKYFTKKVREDKKGSFIYTLLFVLKDKDGFIYTDLEHDDQCPDYELCTISDFFKEEAKVLFLEEELKDGCMIALHHQSNQHRIKCGFPALHDENFFLEEMVYDLYFMDKNGVLSRDYKWTDANKKYLTTKK